MRKAAWCLLLVFCCWGVSWWSWQYQHRSPTVNDIVLSGLILPGVLLLLGWGLQRFFKTTAHENGVSPSLSQAAPDAGVEGRTGQDVRGEDIRKLRRIVGAAPMITRLGGDGATLLQDLRSQEVDFPLDEACLDGDGFPTITARMESLDIEATRASFLSLLAQKGEKSDTSPEPWALLEGEIGPHEWRVLALMIEVIASMGDAVKTYNPYSVMGERKGNVETTMFPELECLLLLPVGLQWSPSTCQQVEMYLSDAVAKWQWPSTRVLIRLVLTREASEGVNVMSRIAKSMREQSENGVERITCIMMADSSFGEDTIRHGQEVSGWIPGEAAAGLMLLPRASSVAFPELEKSSLVMPHLVQQSDTLMSRAAREQWMQDVIHEWLDLQATNVENLAACVSSGGATPAQLVEWMVLANACFDEMRAEDGLLTLQTVLGDVGQVANLLALCVAHEVVLGDEKPVLVVAHDAKEVWQGMLCPTEQ